MKLAILHYHLNRGGVTQVMKSHLQAICHFADSMGVTSVVVLYGGRRNGWETLPATVGDSSTPVEFCSVPALDYDEAKPEGQPAKDVAGLTQAVTSALAAAGCDAGQTLLHVHNHSMVKNLSLPGTLRNLAAAGYRLLLQIHDFAEDLRPANYQRIAAGEHAEADARALYPAAPHIHYAFLNNRDRDLFQSAGGDTSRMHMLPNPVPQPAELPDAAAAATKFRRVHGLRSEQRLMLYPVRAIRRKNIGELLLWAALAGDPYVFAITLPATSEEEAPAYTRWKTLAAELALPMLFEVGLNDQLSFQQNIAAADRIITTSVAEGFGLVFLESWLSGKPLIGRNIPDITADFCEKGLDLTHLGKAVHVPVEWVGRQQLMDRLVALNQQLCSAYGQQSPADIARQAEKLTEGATVDFAVLPAAMQSQVVRRVAGDDVARQQLQQLNPWMRQSLDEDGAIWQTIVPANAQVVRENYSLAATAADLQRIYGILFAAETDAPINTAIAPQQLLHAFLDLQRLHAVRVEP